MLNLFFSTESTSIYNADTLDGLREMPSESVDLVFADPPFNVGYKYNSYKDDLIITDYYEWCGKWINECFRVLKPTGSFYLMTIDRHVGSMMHEMSKHGVFLNIITWQNTPKVFGKNRFRQSCVYIILFSKTETHKFNKNAQTKQVEGIDWWTKKPVKKTISISDSWSDIKPLSAGHFISKESILESKTREKLHPCQLPVDLPKRCIVFSTDEGDTVLDPFAGSFSAAIACLKTNRNFIGFEMDATYCDLGVKRITEEVETLRMFK